MVDTDKPEVVMGPGDDILHGHLLEPLASLGQEPHPPRQEKQPPQHSSSSNGIKMKNDESVHQLIERNLN